MDRAVTLTSAPPRPPLGIHAERSLLSCPGGGALSRRVGFWCGVCAAAWAWAWEAASQGRAGDQGASPMLLATALAMLEAYLWVPSGIAEAVFPLHSHSRGGVTRAARRLQHGACSTAPAARRLQHGALPWVMAQAALQRRAGTI